MNLVAALKDVWRERSIMDAAHSARIFIVVILIESGCQTGGECRRSTLVGDIIDRLFFFHKKCSNNCDTLLGEYPRLSTAHYVLPRPPRAARRPICPSQPA